MRTKVLLCAAALVASLASSTAQNVYSLNVVGYVNVTLPSGFSCVANPLDASVGGTVAGGNDITNLFQNMADGAYIDIFVPSLNDYDPVNIPSYSARSGTWSQNLTMAPGKGVLIYNPGAPQAITFVGQVVQGNYSVANLGASQFTMVGSPVPIGGDITNSTITVGLVPADSDSVATFSNTKNDWNTAVTWSARGGVWSGPMDVSPGAGFLYYNAGTANAWHSNFTVQ